MKHIFITGASGFVGTHLVEYLSGLEEDFEIYGTAFGEGNSLGAYLRPDQILSVNLLDPIATQKAVTLAKPDYVVHLAALTSPAASFKEPEKTLTNNITAEVHLLNSLLDLEKKPEKILVIGSAEEYGLVPEGMTAVNETVPLRPNSPYAVSKIAQDYLGLQYFLTHNLPIVRLRPFNHTGPGQAPAFVLPAFAKQVAEIEAGILPPTIKVGNLESVRDFTDVTDMVRAYYLALLKAVPGEVYNIGSGNGVTIRDILDMLLALARVPIAVETDPERFRPADVQALIADSTLFRSTTGWKPEVDIQDMVERVLDYWRKQTKGNS